VISVLCSLKKADTVRLSRIADEREACQGTCWLLRGWDATITVCAQTIADALKEEIE
jgi:hypothetical protein